MKADFHCHCAPYSTCARQTIDELIRRAKEAEIECIAITNHDTIKDCDLFSLKCKEAGIRYIPGVEIGARVYDKITGIPNFVKIHILGLNIKPSDEFEKEIKSFDDINRSIKDKRNSFIEQKYRIEIPKGTLKKDIRKKLVEAGAFEDEKGAKEFLNSYEIISRFQLEALTPEKAIFLIHQNGGKAILAHPFQGEDHFDFNDDQVENIIQACIKWGLDGIEVFHSSAFKKGKTEFLLNIANKHDLLISIGSDRHFVEDYAEGHYFSFDDQMSKQNFNEINIKEILEKK